MDVVEEMDKLGEEDEFGYRHNFLLIWLYVFSVFIPPLLLAVTVLTAAISPGMFTPIYLCTAGGLISFCLQMAAMTVAMIDLIRMYKDVKDRTMMLIVLIIILMSTYLGVLIFIILRKKMYRQVRRQKQLDKERKMGLAEDEERPRLENPYRQDRDVD